jgi:hypothetical protein
MRVFLILVAVLTLTIIAAGQQGKADPCPTVSVDGPSGIVKPGEVGTYTARVDARGHNIAPLYKWTVSAGSIVSGQGTEVIEVRNPTGWNTTVQVEIQGFPVGCPNLASETSSAGPDLPIPRKLTEITGPLARATFDSIIAAAKEEPDSQLFIFISGSTRNRLRSLSLKRSIIGAKLKRLNEDRRVTIVESTKKDDVTTIWLVPPGATPPLP